MVMVVRSGTLHRLRPAGIQSSCTEGGILFSVAALPVMGPVRFPPVEAVDEAIIAGLATTLSPADKG